MPSARTAAAFSTRHPQRRTTRARTRDLRFSVRIKARPDAVYRALTSATELCRWWLQGAETDARSGGRLRMVWPRLKCRCDNDGGGRSGRLFPPNAAMGDSEGCFVDLEPGRKVAWMWRQSGRRGIPPLSSFFIMPMGRGCEVTLLHCGFSNRSPADKHYDGCSQGWEDCLAKLKLYLETGRACKTQILTFDCLKSLIKEAK
jgi:uncharacterized protein YndB with AHSA1/START domain